MAKQPKPTAPSSNGRTSGSDPANVGSNPAGATTSDPVTEAVVKMIECEQSVLILPEHIRQEHKERESRARQEFIDNAAATIFARHFQHTKAFVQAAELWDARKEWLRREAERTGK